MVKMGGNGGYGLNIVPQNIWRPGSVDNLRQLTKNVTECVHTTQIDISHTTSTNIVADFALGAYVTIATKPMHQLQIRPIVHNYGHPLLFPKLHPGLCSSVGMRRGADRHTHTHTHRRPWPQYILLGYV